MFEANLESIKTHVVPQWFKDAKFGIFIHWGLYSVPAYAPVGKMDLQKLMTGELKMGNSPYAEWYQNSIRIPGSPANTYHRQTYGEDYPYPKFAQVFNQQVEKWDPESWADLFQRAGARYVVPVTKHHDGFLMWPSRNPNPFIPDYHVRRDVLGELGACLSKRGLKMGTYYSSLLDWTFTRAPIKSIPDLMTIVSPTKKYRDYVELHWKELIDRYDTWILWSDIGYPGGYNLAELFAYYYNHKTDGLINDRWMQLPPFLYNFLGRFLVKQGMKRSMQNNSRGGASNPRVPHCDYVTTEYSYLSQASPQKWEACRGIGNSFGYNRFETESEYLSAPALIRELVEIVSANGNLLLNVGPRADGSIPQGQVTALEGIGQWLGVNGEAIFGSIPWVRVQDQVEGGGKVSYTRNGRSLYATITRIPDTRVLALPGLPDHDGAPIVLLKGNQALKWTRREDQLLIELPAGLSENEVGVLKIGLTA